MLRSIKGELPRCANAWLGLSATTWGAIAAGVSAATGVAALGYSVVQGRKAEKKAKQTEAQATIQMINEAKKVKEQQKKLEASEAEAKRRFLARSKALPDTLLTGYSGLTGPAPVYKKQLGGA